MSSVLAAKLDAVSFSYDADAINRQAMMNFTAEFDRGVTTAVMGASGSGKSTMLALLAGFERAQSGTIELEGVDATLSPPAERPLSMVFQNNNLFAHLTVAKNIALGIAPSLRLKPSDTKEVEMALDAVGLAGYGQRLPAQLSGGEAQRVALARVLVRKRPILLLDEAFASLGPSLRDDMLDLVAALTRDNHLSTIMVTHAPQDAQRIAQNLVFLDRGHVVLSGTTADLLGKDGQNDVLKRYLGEGSQT
ncbi:MAG: ATP-binding cassette domain-containing protein [Ahrensia sp.]|nr:ATP-binding cassette domain-containing protein [Ahrensia sp.]